MFQDNLTTPIEKRTVTFDDTYWKRSLEVNNRLNQLIKENKLTEIEKLVKSPYNNYKA